MKFPIATVILVSAALMFIVWERTRDQPEPVDPGRFANLASDPIERSEVVDWVATQIPVLCEEATGSSSGSEAFSECVERGESRSSTCRRAIYDKFPSIIASEGVFRDVSITMMNCLVPQSRPIVQESGH